MATEAARPRSADQSQRSRSWVRRAVPGIGAVLIGSLLVAVYATSRESSSSPEVGAARIKPLLRGLVDRNGVAPPEAREIVRSFVVNVGWAALQPQRGGAIVVPNDIDRAIATARRANQEQPGPGTRLKVRLFSGVQAPEWAKRLNGPPVQVTDTVDARSGTVGRFWTPEFGRAYEELQKRLAARYDGVTELAEVTASRCTTIYAEPFVRQARHKATVNALLGAGFTAEADRRCLEGQVEAHRVWSRTRTSVAFNPYQRIRPDGSVVVDPGFTSSMMSHCRRVLGPRCVLANNSLRWPLLGGAGYRDLYRAMVKLGPPLAFQTAVPRRVGDWRATLEWAADTGANFVELNSDYPSYPLAELARFGRRLEENPIGS